MQQLLNDDWTKLKFIGNLKTSPNRKAFAYSVASTNLDKNRYDTNIHVFDGERHYQLTGMNKESVAIWLDDETLLFSSKRLQEDVKGTQTDFYTISLKGGEALKTFTVPLAVSGIKLLKEGHYLITALTDLRYPNDYKASDKQRDVRAKQVKDEAFFTEVNEIPFYANGSDFTVYQRVRLFHYNVKDNTLVPLTEPSFSVDQFELSSDEQAVYVLGQTFKQLAELNSKLIRIDLNTFVTDVCSTQKFQIYGFKLLNNEIILYGHDGKQLGLNENARFYRILEGRFELMHDPFYSIGNAIGSDIRLNGSELVQVQGDALYFTLTVEDHSQLMRMNVKGDVEMVWEASGSLDGYAFVENDIYVMGLFNQDAQDIYQLKGKEILRKTSFNEEVFKDVYRAVPKSVSVKFEEHSVDGWVLLPKDYDETKTYPAILDIHGGPKTVYGPVYYHEMQVWANKGYMVMFCNPRGSDGKGNAFSDIRGKYGTIDYEDIMAFVDEVIRNYPIDIKRIGVTGGSYGGFMTNWIIGHTQRFKCAATQRSISNWLSFYGTSDIGYYFATDQGGTGFTKDSDFNKLWDHSPLKYISSMKTPTLIIHSSKDYRCPVEQAYQLFTALKHNKVASKMVLFHEENHDLSRSGNPKARQKRLIEITNWMDKYLKSL